MPDPSLSLGLVPHTLSFSSSLIVQVLVFSEEEERWRPGLVVHGIVHEGRLWLEVEYHDGPVGPHRRWEHDQR